MEKLKTIKLFLLDMDGTIYLGDRLFDGTVEFLDYVRKIGGRAVFLTNNSSKGIEQYVEKLRCMGIYSSKDDFFTSTDATILFLKKKAYKKIYAFGTESFKKQLSQANLPIVDRLEEDIDCLCMGFDTELTFQKLEDACILINRGVAYIATNPDWVCPTWYGYVPDCGSISQILYNATKKMPEFIGKPKPTMAELVMERTGYTKESTALIGDRLYTDIACGAGAGISTIFVLSGEGTMQDVEASDIKPDFIYKNIQSLYEDLSLTLM